MTRKTAEAAFSPRSFRRGIHAEDLMNKYDLVQTLARTSRISTEEAKLIFSIFIQTIKNGLLQGDRVELRGFGSFTIKTREARTARNPKTGQYVEVKARRVPFFRAGKELKALINNSNSGD